ncbi:hypothetical protein [Acinetobacter wuhouensis]|uniref:DUF4393 domain-containing protein n=1 Tax=Acinetobacter wuhouensis TaxID=1879050 RepID=A0A4Q7AGG8_9GAMM|nr:hypothetical protein [Acinetobacter wuhouensis]RZG44592.1 hypothetical protein EXU28_14365 [Acinetobacter wuhouensis]RZG73937.1 hypothetical protein EXU29_05595 [Acinetobacter wuhouensis]
MPKKLKIHEPILNTVENLADEIIFKSATTFLEDSTKSIPVASIILNLTTAYSNYQTSKNQKQLLSFISQLQSADPEFIEKFFQDKSNTELGYEILGILDQTYLEKQAKMIGRTILLFKDDIISKLEFDRYTYIITRLNNHIFHLINELYNIEMNRDTPNFEFDIENPNMEFVNFGFLEEVPSPLYPGSTQITKFKRTPNFYYFYEKIFID